MFHLYRVSAMATPAILWKTLTMFIGGMKQNMVKERQEIVQALEEGKLPMSFEA